MIDVEKLDVDLWLDRSARLRRKAEEPEICEVEPLIRRAYFLAQLAPVSGSILREHLLEEEKFEALLEMEAHESALASLIGQFPSWQVSHLENELYEAFVSLGSAQIDGHGKAMSLACAVLSAWLDFAIKLVATTSGERSAVEEFVPDGAQFSANQIAR